MDGLRILLLGIGVLIIIINFFINSANIIIIVNFCFQTKGIGKYWDLFFKSCVHRRAIISSIIGFIVFIIITPIILLRAVASKKKTSELLNEECLIQHQDLNLENENIQFKSNLNSGFKSAKTKKKKQFGEEEKLKKQAEKEAELINRRKEKEDPSRFMPK